MHGTREDDFAERSGAVFVQSLAAEAPDGVLGAEELPGQVDVDHLAPVVQGHFGERRIALDSGVRDHDVDAAQPLVRGVEQMLAVAGFGHVDAAAYRQLLSSSADRLRPYFSRRIGRDAADVEDLVQETLIAIHQRRDSYDRRLPYTSWLHSIARYKLVDHYRRRGAKRSIPVDDFQEFAARDDIEPALAAYDVEALLAGLTEKQRAAIRLTRLEGYSVAEAAGLSGQSEAAIKIGVHRGLRRLSALVRGSE